MKILFAVLLSFLCLVGEVEGAVKSKNVVNGISTNFIGSIAAVTRHCLSSGRYIDIIIYQNGILVGTFSSLHLEFKSMEEINAFFVRELTKVAQGAVTNNFGQNKLEDFMIGASFSTHDNDYNGRVNYLIHNGTFRLTKQADGSFKTPSFDKHALSIPEIVLYKLTDVVWGKVTSTDLSGNSVDGESKIFVQEKFLSISAEVATNASTYKTDIRYLDKSQNLFIFDGYGNRVSEKQPSLQIFGSSETLGALTVKNVGRTTSNPNTVSLMVNGGEVGRTYQIQCSDSVVGNWMNIGGEVTPRRVDDPGTISHSEPIQNGGKFYRVITLKKIPYLP